MTPLATAPQPAPQALLLLGLAERAQHDPDADVTLRRFLAAAPDDPSAGSVRALLGAAR